MAVVAVALVSERVRVLLFQAPLDTPAWLRHLIAALARGDKEQARALVDAAEPAWVATLAGRAMSEGVVPSEERFCQLRDQAFERLYALRALASLGSMTGFLGAVIELIWLMSGDHGLAGLQAGLPAKLALEAAALSMVIGVSITVFCFAALSILRKAAVDLIGDMQRAMEAVGAAGDGG